MSEYYLLHGPLHGSPLFNRAAFEGYTRASNSRQFSGMMAGLLIGSAAIPYVVAAAPFIAQGFGIAGGAARTVGGRLLILARNNWQSAAWDFGGQSVFNLFNSNNPLTSNNYSTTVSSLFVPKKYFWAAQVFGNAFGYNINTGYIGYGSETPVLQTSTNVLLGTTGAYFSRGFNYATMRYLKWERPFGDAIGNYFGIWIFGTPQWIIDRYYRQLNKGL